MIHKRWLGLVVAGGALAVVGCSEQSTGPTTTAANTPAFSEFANQGNRVHVMLTRGLYEAAAHTGAAGGGGGPAIQYHGGPVITSLNTPNIVAIYWAATASQPIYIGGPAAGAGLGTADGSLIGTFLRSLGGSSYWNINTTYYDGSGNFVKRVLNYTGFWATSSGPASGSPSNADIQNLIAQGFSSGKLTYNSNTVYAVFTASGVNLGGGFGTQYCAYHGYFNLSGFGVVKYAAEPYDYQYPSACSALSGSPNADPAGDAEVNTLAHETEEFTTDPQLNAWYDTRGYENADKCAWTFGTTYRTGNGAVANMNIGGKDYLIQQNWIRTGGCAKSYP